MDCWIVLYHSRHGTDVWPVFQEKRPTQSQMIKIVSRETTWEPDKGEWVEERGPWKVPKVGKEELGDAYSKGWDSHEGSLLNSLGIRDLECMGIDLIVKDLVKHCPGFKKWRRRFKEGSIEQKQSRARRRQ